MPLSFDTVVLPSAAMTARFPPVAGEQPTQVQVLGLGGTENPSEIMLSGTKAALVAAWGLFWLFLAVFWGVMGMGVYAPLLQGSLLLAASIFGAVGIPALLAWRRRPAKPIRNWLLAGNVAGLLVGILGPLAWLVDAATAFAFTL